MCVQKWPHLSSQAPEILNKTIHFLYVVTQDFRSVDEQNSLKKNHRTALLKYFQPQNGEKSKNVSKHLQKPKGRERLPNPNPVKYLGTI